MGSEMCIRDSSSTWSSNSNADNRIVDGTGVSNTISTVFQATDFVASNVGFLATPVVDGAAEFGT